MEVTSMKEGHKLHKLWMHKPSLELEGLRRRNAQLRRIHGLDPADHVAPAALTREQRSWWNRAETRVRTYWTQTLWACGQGDGARALAAEPRSSIHKLVPAAAKLCGPALTATDGMKGWQAQRLEMYAEPAIETLSRINAILEKTPKGRLGDVEPDEKEKVVPIDRAGPTVTSGPARPSPFDKLRSKTKSHLTKRR